MSRSTWILLAVLATLALPAAASARPLDTLRKAQLQAATGAVTISEERCPQGVQPGSGAGCGHVKLNADFDAGPKPRTRAAAGRPDFPAGLRIGGRGTGQCEAESPPTVITGPDGSVQFLGSAARVEPGGFDATRIVLASTRRGVRVAWLEPLAPGIACDYFSEPGTELALPVGQALPATLVSPVVSARVLKRTRFSVTIAGSQEWNDQAADGTQIAGRANWRLRLDYRRSG